MTAVPTAVEESVAETTERSLPALLGVVLAFVLVMGGPAAAFLLTGADSTGGVSRVGLGGDRVERVALTIEKRFSSVPGYADVIADGAHGRITVRWQGKPPEELVSFAWSLPTGVVVRIEAARYSSARLFAAAAALTQQAREAGLALTSVGPNGDHSGLVAAVELGEDGEFGEASAQLQSWSDIAIVVRPSERAKSVYRSGVLTRP